LTHPLLILTTWHGGLGIYGAALGGLLGLYLYLRRRGLDFLYWADIVIASLPLGQAIGRWGNFFNQELYGPPTTLPWGIQIAPLYRVPPFNDLVRYPAETRFHPLFLYESLWNLLVCVALLLLGRRFGGRLLKGELLASYFVLYPLGRFFLEFLRFDSHRSFGLPTGQWLSAVSVAIALAVIIGRRIWARRKITAVGNPE